MAERMLDTACVSTYGAHRCCRPNGHRGVHEEWTDKTGKPVTPIVGLLSAFWPGDNDGSKPRGLIADPGLIAPYNEVLHSDGDVR